MPTRSYESKGLLILKLLKHCLAKSSTVGKIAPLALRTIWSICWLTLKCSPGDGGVGQREPVRYGRH
jgi:hypothetical protein